MKFSNMRVGDLGVGGIVFPQGVMVDISTYSLTPDQVRTISASVAAGTQRAEDAEAQQMVGLATKPNVLFDLPQTASAGGSLGTFADVSALETAYPAASNAGYSALVGASAPYLQYVSNGSAWSAGVSGGGLSKVAISGTKNGVNTAFTIPDGTVSTCVPLLNGIALEEGINFSRAGGAITVISPMVDSGDTFTALVSSGGGLGSVGTYANAGDLETAFPAASTLGRSALVGASAPYTPYISNGSAWATLGGGGGSAVVTESLTGTKNGVNDTFTIPTAPTSWAAVYWGATRLLEGTGYTRSGATVTMLAGFIPQSGDALYADHD